MGLITKLFGTYSQRELKSIYPIVDKITALEPEYKALTDAQLQAKTPEFKQRLQQGETLDDILPEAFAACREAADRVLGMRHFPVQVMGGIILHQGRIAEMKTGEGKTLVATLPAYLNALSGKGVHVVTVNEYLARRDSEWMGNLYRWMGLTVGLATVYRQLDKLPQQGLVHKVTTEEGALYQFCPQAGHPHDCFLLRCEGCGRMVHLDCQHLEEVCRHLSSEHHFRIDPRRTVLTGLCDHCQEAKHEG